MTLLMLDKTFTICKIASMRDIDFSDTFLFLSKTDDELSLVCESGSEPKDAIQADAGWRAFKIDGILDFGMVGVIAGISRILAEASIGLFVVSTYNTDYVLVHLENAEKAAAALERGGYSR